VGGSCAQPTVIRESLKALSDGQPRFLRMCPPEKLRGHTPGVVEVALTCISGGTLEIYLEPHLPQPQILAIGHLPVVEALTTLAKDMGYGVMVAGEGASREQFPRADTVQEFNVAQLAFTPQTYVVVASHGNYDEPALEAALHSNAAYVALIASHKRRDAVLTYLRQSGLPEDKLARLRCPAGLNFGAVTPDEIALSILAEIVQIRRNSPISNPPTVIASAPLEAIDPVCGMTVEIATARYTSIHAGQTYYFCAPGCQRSFEHEPEKYLITNNQ
jgi:xanthine dehydrogenase accessory factor